MHVAGLDPAERKLETLPSDPAYCGETWVNRHARHHFEPHQPRPPLSDECRVIARENIRRPKSTAQITISRYAWLNSAKGRGGSDQRTHLEAPPFVC
jgi:hypothetical protein